MQVRLNERNESGTVAGDDHWRLLRCNSVEEKNQPDQKSNRLIPYLKRMQINRTGKHSMRLDLIGKTNGEDRVAVFLAANADRTAMGSDNLLADT